MVTAVVVLCSALIAEAQMLVVKSVLIQIHAAIFLDFAGGMSVDPQDTVKKYTVSFAIASQKLHTVRDLHSKK